MGPAEAAAPPPEIVGLGGSPMPTWLEQDAVASVRAAEGRPFTETEYDGRLEQVRRRMAGSGIDAMVVFRPSSIEYICGYHTAERAPQPLLVTATDTALYVPDLELGRALTSARVGTVGFCGYADALRSLELFLAHAVSALPSRARVGVELGHTSTPPQAVELLRGQDVGLVPGDHLVERVRLRLSPAEVRCVEEAAVHTQAGFEAAAAAARQPDASDSVVGAAAAAGLVARANSTPAWGPVVATGRRGGIPHSSWVNRPLGTGTTFVELSGAHHRYHAPVMRTLVRGRPDASEQRLAELAGAALTAVLETARPGVTCAEVAERAAAAIAPLPPDVVFHQMFGYPVGLAHPPHWMDGAPCYLTVDNHEPLEEGMVFHVPASFRSFGRSGVGLSHTFVVEAGGARVLTHGTAELTEV